MLPKKVLAYIFASFVFMLATFGASAPKVALAGSGSIPEFSVDDGLHVHIKVSCPGNVGFSWQVTVDSWSTVFYEESSAGKDFTLDGSRIGNGHHNALARVRCNGESTDWSTATTATVGFDYYGGNPTPAPVPQGYEVAISINVAPTTVSTNTGVNITASASCSGTTVRSIQILANSSVVYELGTNVVTYTWSTATPGTYNISARVACNGDDTWHTAANAAVAVTVQQGATSSGGAQAGGTAGNPVNPPAVNPQVNPPSGGDAKWPDAQQSGVPGGLNLSVLALHMGHDNVHFVNGVWYWFNGGQQLGAVDFGQACRDVYGSNYGAIHVNNSASGWQCTIGGSNPPQVANPQVVNPQQQGNCPSSPSRLSVGQIAIVSDADQYPLKVWDNHGDNNAPTSFQIPIREQVTVIEAPFCENGRVWVKIGWQGKQGFAVEVNSAGNYNLIPNGQPLPGGNKPQVNPVPGNPSAGPNPNTNNCVASDATTFTIGQRVIVPKDGGGPTALRKVPNSPIVIVEMPEGTQVTVVAGPYSCAEGVTWWGVKTDNGQSGWVIETYQGAVGIAALPSQPVVPPQAATQAPVQQNPQGIQLSKNSWNGLENDLDTLDLTAAATYQVQPNGNRLLRTLSIDYRLDFQNLPVTVCWSFARADIYNNGKVIHSYIPGTGQRQWSAGLFNKQEGHYDFLPSVNVENTQNLVISIEWICYPKGDYPDPLTDATKSEIEKQADDAMNNNIDKLPRPPKIISVTLPLP